MRSGTGGPVRSGPFVFSELGISTTPNFPALFSLNTVWITAAYFPDGPVTDISSGWDLVRSLAGVPYRLHDLRHTFCTRLAEAGAPESTMLALMGHMSRAMLERYSHIRMAAKRDAVSAITLRPRVENSEVVPVKVPVVAALTRIQ
jgi:integrase